MSQVAGNLVGLFNLLIGDCFILGFSWTFASVSCTCAFSCWLILRSVLLFYFVVLECSSSFFGGSSCSSSRSSTSAFTFKLETASWRPWWFFYQVALTFFLVNYAPVHCSIISSWSKMSRCNSFNDSLFRLVTLLALLHLLRSLISSFKSIYIWIFGSVYRLADFDSFNSFESIRPKVKMLSPCGLLNVKLSIFSAELV